MRNLFRHFEQVADKHGIEGGLELMPDPHFPFTPRDSNGRKLKQREVPPMEDDE